MRNITTTKASDRYSCNLCRNHFDSPENLYEIYIGSINVCLCTECFRQVRSELNKVILEGEQE